MNNAKIVLVHEYLTRPGGAERVLHRFSQIYAQSDIYTLLFDPERMSGLFEVGRIHTSFLQKFPRFLKNRPKYLGFLAPSAVESFDLSRYTVIISSSNSFAKGVVTKPQAIHICYCHAPTSFIWDGFYHYRKSQRKGAFLNFGMAFLAHYLRQWDRQAADRVDYFIANSKTTQKRIKKFYRRDSELIYPPVDIHRFTPTAEHNNTFLIVSQLTPYKNIDIAIEAFNKLRLPLIIIGEGPDRKRLESLAEDTIVFKGYLSDEETTEYYQKCKAFIFPGKDDFGIAPVEAMAAGKPVLALREGGATETIIEGTTGEFFDAAIPELVADGVRRLNNRYEYYDEKTIRAQAEHFSQEVFDAKIQEYIDQITPSQSKEKVLLIERD